MNRGCFVYNVGRRSGTVYFGKRSTPRRRRLGIYNGIHLKRDVVTSPPPPPPLMSNVIQNSSIRQRVYGQASGSDDLHSNSQTFRSVPSIPVSCPLLNQQETATFSDS